VDPRYPLQPFDPDSADLGNPNAKPTPLPGDYLLFALRAARRRKGLTILVLVACIAVLTTYYMSKTPQYRAETRILAQRQQSLPSIVRSNVAEDLPTRAASEIIHRRENLLDLANQAGLLEAPPKSDMLDRLRSMAASGLSGSSGVGEPLDELLDVLDRRLKVDVGEVTIAIQIDWPNPQQAYRIVEGALQNFLEARHVLDVTALDDAIAILQGRAAVAADALAKATEETRRAIQQDAGRSYRTPTNSRSSPPLPRQASEDLARLKSRLDAKERAINDVEQFRRRRLSELQAQYDARRAVYAEAHPEMANLRLDIAALNRDSPQITTLREEERALREEYQARLARERGATGGSQGAFLADQRPPVENLQAAVEQSERVREARSRYQQISESLNSAQVELDTARAAFKHRYKVIKPAQVSKHPVSPNPLKVFGLGGIASLLFAFAVSAAADWRSGRVLERWQVERGLGLPVIADLRDR